jgi:hypothetical protein
MLNIFYWFKLAKNIKIFGYSISLRYLPIYKDVSLFLAVWIAMGKCSQRTSEKVETAQKGLLSTDGQPGN